MANMTSNVTVVSDIGDKVTTFCRCRHLRHRRYYLFHMSGVIAVLFLILTISLQAFCHASRTSTVRSPQRRTSSGQGRQTTTAIRNACRCGHSHTSSSSSRITSFPSPSQPLSDHLDIFKSSISHEYHELNRRQIDGQMDRVVGGHESTPGSFPWMVGLLDGFGFNFCGGALIKSNYILTAAHCIHNKRVNELSAVVGQTDLDVAYLYGRVHRLSSILVHPSFTPSNWSHDIAIIKLVRAIHHVEPICLPSTSTQRWFDNLIVAGWGRTTPSSSAINSFKPSRLHQVFLPQVDQYFCERTWVENFVGPNQLCAGSAGKDTCIYDSGSPLMSIQQQSTSTDHWTSGGRGTRGYRGTGGGNASTGNGSNAGEQIAVLAGVTSFGSKRCGDPEKPGVYTRVGSYLDWIYDNTKDAVC